MADAVPKTSEGPEAELVQFPAELLPGASPREHQIMRKPDAAEPASHAKMQGFGVSEGCLGYSKAQSPYGGTWMVENGVGAPGGV
ncbi:MAG: hypothetical protein ABI323_01500, partial [Solirubrobacteraceae bacterium]